MNSYIRWKSWTTYKKTQVVLVDKDLQNIRMITEYFTEARILLCVLRKGLRNNIFGDRQYDKAKKEAV